MQIELVVTLTDDAGKVSRSSVNRLAVATDLPGADPAVQKQDFLGQVENLVRMVVENQVPALYAAVDDGTAEDTDEPETESEAQTVVRGKLKALRNKREPDDGQNATDQLKEQV